MLTHTLKIKSRSSDPLSNVFQQRLTFNHNSGSSVSMNYRVHTISAQNAIASKRAAPNPNPSPYGLRKSALTGRCIWVVRAYRLLRNYQPQGRTSLTCLYITTLSPVPVDAVSLFSDQSRLSVISSDTR